MLLIFPENPPLYLCSFGFLYVVCAPRCIFTPHTLYSFCCRCRYSCRTNYMYIVYGTRCCTVFEWIFMHTAYIYLYTWHVLLLRFVLLLTVIFQIEYDFLLHSYGDCVPNTTQKMIASSGLLRLLHTKHHIRVCTSAASTQHQQRPHNINYPICFKI